MQTTAFAIQEPVLSQHPFASHSTQWSPSSTRAVVLKFIECNFASCFWDSPTDLWLLECSSQFHLCSVQLRYLAPMCRTTANLALAQRQVLETEDSIARSFQSQLFQTARSPTPGQSCNYCRSTALESSCQTVVLSHWRCAKLEEW